MKVEISRRRFLQGTVAMSVVGGVSLSSSSIMASATKPAKKVGNEDRKVEQSVKCVSINAPRLHTCIMVL
jgi:hypothetical protein